MRNPLPPRPFLKSNLVGESRIKDKLLRHARVQSRVLMYAIADLFTSLFAIIAILVLYPLVYDYDKFSS